MPIGDFLAVGQGFKPILDGCEGWVRGSNFRLFF